MAALTVFTPAYNRAHTLPRTYESLCSQSCKDFVWLIVDDGSADNTAELVRSWQEKGNGFEIRYIYKENGGMHTAHNTAYENIDTELNTCIDSDDCMASGALEKILRKWESVRDQGYAGLIALDSDMDGNIIGQGFPEGLTETTLTGYYAAGGSGDKKLIYRTDITNQYPPYPVFEGERYVALAYKYRLHFWLFYAMLGGWIARNPEPIAKLRSGLKLWKVLACLLITVLYVRYMGRYAYGGADLELFYGSILVQITGFLVFVYGQGLKLSEITGKWIVRLGSLTMGIYIMPPFVLAVLNKFVPAFTGGGAVMNLLFWLLTTAVCAVATVLVQKIPVLNRLLKL